MVAAGGAGWRWGGRHTCISPVQLPTVHRGVPVLTQGRKPGSGHDRQGVRGGKGVGNAG